MGLHAKELLGGAWTKSDSEIRAPAVVALTARFNYVSSWVASEILQRKDTKERKDIISMFINVASRARVIGSFNTTMEILAGLNNGAVQRLKKTWEMLTKKEKSVSFFSFFLCCCCFEAFLKLFFLRCSMKSKSFAQVRAPISI